MSAKKPFLPVDRNNDRNKSPQAAAGNKKAAAAALAVRERDQACVSSGQFLM